MPYGYDKWRRQKNIGTLNLIVGTLLSMSPSSPMTRDTSSHSSSSSLSHFRDSKTHLRTSSASRILPSIATPVKTNPVEPSLCLPEHYDMIVYRAQDRGNSSELIQVPLTSSNFNQPINWIVFELVSSTSFRRWLMETPSSTTFGCYSRHWRRTRFKIWNWVI